MRVLGDMMQTMGALSQREEFMLFEGLPVKTLRLFDITQTYTVKSPETGNIHFCIHHESIHSLKKPYHKHKKKNLCNMALRRSWHRACPCDYNQCQPGEPDAADACSYPAWFQPCVP